MEAPSSQDCPEVHSLAAPALCLLFNYRPPQSFSKPVPLRLPRCSSVLWLLSMPLKIYGNHIIHNTVQVLDHTSVKLHQRWWRRNYSLPPLHIIQTVSLYFKLRLHFATYQKTVPPKKAHQPWYMYILVLHVVRSCKKTHGCTQPSSHKFLLLTHKWEISYQSLKQFYKQLLRQLQQLATLLSLLQFVCF